MNAAVLIQTYGPLPELGGMDGLIPCEAVLAADLVAQGRAEIVNPHLEAFRYVPGSRAYEAMRASRGQPGPVQLPQAQPAKRPRGRPRKVVKS
jgi:hypothetical protein